MYSNWRFNVFTGILHAVLIENEEHTIEYHADFNAYAIQLNEAPRLDNPSSVVIVEDVTGGSTFSELPRSQAPAAGQYRVDYDALTYYGTGRIEFAAADIGKKVLVSYYGTGWTVKNNYRVGQTIIPANLEVEEDTVLHGDLTLDGENTGGGDLHVAGDADIDGALEVNGGIVGALTGNADTASQADNATTADGIHEVGIYAKTLVPKIIPIGLWNLYITGGGTATNQKIIAHGLADVDKIICVEAKIIPDNLTMHSMFIGVDANGHRGNIDFDDTNVYLYTLAGSKFDTSLYDSMSMNRGYIIIWYTSVALV